MHPFALKSMRMKLLSSLEFVYNYDFKLTNSLQVHGVYAYLFKVKYEVGHHCCMQ